MKIMEANINFRILGLKSLINALTLFRDQYTIYNPSLLSFSMTESHMKIPSSVHFKIPRSRKIF